MIGCDRQQRSRYRADALWLVLGWPARLDSRDLLPLLIRPERSVIWIGLFRERGWLRVSYHLRGLYLLGSRESSERLDSVIQTESVAEVDESGYCISVVLSLPLLFALLTPTLTPGTSWSRPSLSYPSRSHRTLRVLK